MIEYEQAGDIEQPQRRGGMATLVSQATAPVVGGGIWTVAAKLASQAAQLATFVVAARVLTPAEFGFFAFTSAIAMLVVVLAEGGWAEFIMKSGDAHDMLNEVATISFASGLFFTALGLAASALCYFVLDKRWEGVLLAMFSCWMLPAALTATYSGALIRRGQLRDQAIIRVVAETAGIVVTVAGLLAGWNVLALVAGRLVIQLLTLAGSAFAFAWLPRLRLTRAALIEVLEFSRHIVANRLIIFVWSYSGTLAVGGFLGIADAGFYRAAERIVATLSELIGEPARLLGWVVFKRAHDRDEGGAQGAVMETGNLFLPVLLAISTPVFLGLMLVSDNLVYFGLGKAWEPTAPIVAVLSVRQLLLIPGCITEPLLSVTGNVRRRLPVSLLNAVVSVSLIAALAPFGLMPVAFGQCLAASVAFATSVRLQGRFGGLDWRQILQNSAIVVLPVLVMLAAVFGVDSLAALSALQRLPAFLLQMLTGALAYILLFMLLYKRTGKAAALVFPKQP